MNRRDLIVILICVFVFPILARASSLTLGDAFSAGGTIFAADFNNKFNAISNWSVKGIGADNITDASVTGTIIAAATITASNVVTDTLTATEIAAGAIGASELATNAVDTDSMLALNVTTAKVAVDAAQVVYTLEEGTMTAGDCSTPITMDVSDTRPAANAVLIQNINPDDTNFADETILVHLMASVECKTNCGNGSQDVNLSCNWDASDDVWVASHNRMDKLNGGGADLPITFHYTVSYTPADGDAADVFCVIWENGGNTSTWDYCARMIVQHVKR